MQDHVIFYSWATWLIVVLSCKFSVNLCCLSGVSHSLLNTKDENLTFAPKPESKCFCSLFFASLNSHSQFPVPWLFLLWQQWTDSTGFPNFEITNGRLITASIMKKLKQWKSERVLWLLIKCSEFWRIENSLLSMRLVTPHRILIRF